MVPKKQANIGYLFKLSKSLEQVGDSLTMNSVDQKKFSIHSKLYKEFCKNKFLVISICLKLEKTPILSALQSFVETIFYLVVDSSLREHFQ